MNFEQLPEDIPVPEDDGACDHLTGIIIPKIILNATNSEEINIGNLHGYTVIYIYPMTGQPNIALPEGWDSIPGARGCTPQSCSFRDIHSDLIQYASIYGLSSQVTDYQFEAKSRLHLPFELLSDTNFLLKQKLSLPTFSHEGVERYKRVTLILKNNLIKKVFFPVFPPDENPTDVLNWLEQQ
ncbi:MAG: redoxin family protein [Proteobacteria bacterium]|nr:peroxiredoxin [Pseudomonadota bacterium]NOG61035.1 redoxin family protein [Pseudomonadota bacterium]